MIPPVTVHSFAKINLTLDVLRRRDDDGYHELQSIVHTVALRDTLHFEFDDCGEDSIACNIAELASADNLCLRALRAWRRATNSNGAGSGPRVHIVLHKAIPAGAGLGGGSGNAAATLRALCHAFPGALEGDALSTIATELGADVPLFLRGGCLLIEGIGERIRPLPLGTGWALVVQPDISLGTPRVFDAWDAAGLQSACATPRLLARIDSPNHTDGWMANSLQGYLHNDLAFAAEACGAPIATMLAYLRRNGAAEANMTGSGSAVYGLFAGEDEARDALSTLRAAELMLDTDIGAGVTLRYAEVAPLNGDGVHIARNPG